MLQVEEGPGNAGEGVIGQVQFQLGILLRKRHICLDVWDTDNLCNFRDGCIGYVVQLKAAGPVSVDYATAGAVSEVTGVVYSRKINSLVATINTRLDDPYCFSLARRQAGLRGPWDLDELMPRES